MQAETQANIDAVRASIELLRTHVDFDAAQARLDQLETLSASPDFWNDQASAQDAMREKNRLERQLEMITTLQSELDDAVGLIELGEAEGDMEVVAEAEEAIGRIVQIAEKRQLESLLSGEADGNDCFLEIHAGAGGTEAQDWAQMLARMYSRWCEARGFKMQMIEESPGEEAGIKSVTMRIEGDNAYGWLKTESGVHRLVRISPFDSSARRHTSFASAWVYPVVDDNIEIEVEDKDLRIDTYRASGAGGQHVNKTDSAIRITHLPTNIVVQCQNDRSQHRNRATAFNMLKPGSMSLNCKSVKMRLRTPPQARLTLDGVTRSGHMFCTPIRWSKTCAPMLKRAMLPVFWTVILTNLSRPVLPPGLARSAHSNASPNPRLVWNYPRYKSSLSAIGW